MMKAAAVSMAVALALSAGTAMGQATSGPATTQAAATQGSGRKVAVVELGNPRAIAIDEAGTLYVVDVGNNKIVKITRGGDVSTANGPGMETIASPIGVWVGKGGEMLVGSCLPGHFFDPPALLSQNYGCDINAAWTVVGVLNTAPPAPAPPLPTGNAVEDMFERLALAVNRIHRVASAPDFPAMSVTPLAIYRTL